MNRALTISPVNTPPSLKLVDERPEVAREIISPLQVYVARRVSHVHGDPYTVIEREFPPGTLERGGCGLCTRCFAHRDGCAGTAPGHLTDEQAERHSFN